MGDMKCDSKRGTCLVNCRDWKTIAINYVLMNEALLMHWSFRGAIPWALVIHLSNDLRFKLLWGGRIERWLTRTVPSINALMPMNCLFCVTKITREHLSIRCKRCQMSITHVFHIGRKKCHFCNDVHCRVFDLLQGPCL